MCVIFVAEKTRPTPQMVEQGYDANNSGAGVAWQEINETTQLPVVRWEKGLTLVEAKEFAETLPLPFVMHFRIPSCGGAYKILCHPFPIAPDVALHLTGETEGSVLFHNGHWATWKDHVMREARERRVQIPEGKWTDTRGMAWLAYLYGVPVLDLIDEKSVVFSPEDIEIFGSGWTKVNDVWCSNTHWQSRGTTYYAGNAGNWHGGTGFVECRKSDCKSARYGNSMYCWTHQFLDPQTKEGKDYEERQRKAREEEKASGGTLAEAEATFRQGSPTIQDGSTEQQAVEEGKKGVGKGYGDDLQEKAQARSQVDPNIKLLGPAPEPQVLAVEGDSPEDWATFRRWVRRLNDDSVASLKKSLDDDTEDRAARRNERRAGFIRVGPL